ncbi:SRPBCC family protein [Demequina soli]|uniref:SRPBCC family protein n=1 Tax=Demequina soli TaxID=1638987 RepID=UPI00078246F3|nr:SRPBCC domain-containing protein [Demequina soli]
MSTLKTIEVDQFLAHPPAVVWRALTDPALLESWWAPSDIVPEVGRAFTITFPDWGVQRCTVTAVDEPRTLAYTFSEGLLDSTITWTLVPEGAGTRLLLAHAGFDVDTPIGLTGFTGMGHGWPLVVAHLGTVLDAA